MTTAVRPLRFQGAVSTRAEAGEYPKSPGNAVLIERGRPRLLMLTCPCGCGEDLAINLDSRAGAAWQLYGSSRIGFSLFPSVWRTSGCRSHFIIWHNRILLFDSVGTDVESVEADIDAGLHIDAVSELRKAVQERLPRKGLAPFAEIAKSLNAVPWDVLTACRQLVEAGAAREGKGKQRGQFGRSRLPAFLTKMLRKK